MEKEFSLKKFFVRLLIILPLIYIGFGWWIGVNYGQKSVIFGPYADIPIVVKTSLLGSSLQDISGSKALVMVTPPKEVDKSDPDSTYFKVTGYFEVPGIWDFDFSPSGSDILLPKTFAMTGSYSRAIFYELKNPRHRLGSLPVSELYDLLKAAGRTKDTLKLMPYLFISRLEEKYPWLYSDTVFLSRAMSNIFKDNMVPYDILGLTGILVLFIALSIRSFWLWMYYLYWVFAYWFARIGYHDPNLIMSNEGQQVILWCFWNGFIQKEGRIFLIIAFILSVIGFVALAFIYLVKHVIPRMKRETEDFLKVDKDIQKRKEPEYSGSLVN